jgi:hypothetical protein
VLPLKVIVGFDAVVALAGRTITARPEKTNEKVARTPTAFLERKVSVFSSRVMICS